MGEVFHREKTYATQEVVAAATSINKKLLLLLALLVTSAFDLPLRTIKLCSVLFGKPGKC